MIACSPIPRGGLSIPTRTVELLGTEVHLVIRIDRESLAHAQWLELHVTAEHAEAVVILPDDPEHGGTSFARDERVGFNVRATADLRSALDSACDSGGTCEIGVTVIVEPSLEAGAPEPTEIELSIRAATAPDGEFPESARLELEIDGEPPVLAERGSF